MAPKSAAARAFGGAPYPGFAPFSLSAAATPIVTDSAGIEAGLRRMAVQDGTLPAYVAAPRGAGKHPVVIVVPEVWGLHEYIRDICRRFAKEGFVAIAPDFFARAGDPAPLTEWTEIAKIVATVGHEQAMGDVGAALDLAGGIANADVGRIAITGFCWGGFITWMACATFPQLKAGVAWYGRLVRPAPPHFLATPGRPFPVDVAAKLKCPVLGLYAEKDESIPLKDVDAMRAALATAGNTTSSIHVYPGTQHGFHADYREVYDAAAAKDGWQRMKAHFAANGVA